MQVIMVFLQVRQQPETNAMPEIAHASARTEA